MFQLLQVPLDIILSVLDFLEMDKLSNRNLLLSCRAFRGIISERLMLRHVELRSVSSLPTQLRDFNAALSASASAGAAVQTLKLCNCNCTIDVYGRQHYFLQALHAMPNLRELFINVVAGGFKARSASRIMPQLPRLERVELTDEDKGAHTELRRPPAFSREDMIFFMSLPFVTSFSAVQIRTGILRTPTGTLQEELWTLERLRLTGYGSFNFTISILISFFAACKRLREFECDFPCESADQGAFAGKTFLRAFVRTLKLVKSSLVRLRIHGEDMDFLEPLSADGSRLDVSDFPSLKELRAPSFCFFPPGCTCEGREDMYACLPRSLEICEIAFGRMTSIWHQVIDYGAPMDGACIARVFQQDETALYGPHSNWLWDISTNKARLYPSLREFRVVESGEPCLTWPTPRALSSYYDSRGY